MTTGPPPEATAAALRSQSARAAALTRWATIPPAERSRRARAAFRKRFEKQVDPNLELAPADRAVLVDAAIRAYNAQVTYKRMRSRARREAGGSTGATLPPRSAGPTTGSEEL